jgi:hypothetical protein
MFQGMYTSARFMKIFGKSLFTSRLKQIEGDIVDYYLNNEELFEALSRPPAEPDLDFAKTFMFPTM